MDNHFSWTKYSFVIQGATSATRIKFGDEDTKTYRIHLDNIRVEKAETGAEAPEPQPVTIPLDVRITPQSFGEIPAEGDDLACSIHINRAWSAASDSEWLTIEKVNCGTAANGATLAADKRSVTVLGTWLPYNDIVLKAAPNTDGEARTATLTLTIDGESTPLTMNVTQAGVAAGTPRITVTGLNNYAVPPFASEATQPRTFTVNATYDWTISVPEGDTWYTVSPLQGPANSDTEVTVIPTANPDAARGGTFTIVSKNGGLETKQPITVSQEANANVFSGLPATWTFDTASKLTADLKYPADETGSTALFAYDRKGLASDENGVVSITGGYLKLAGVPCRCALRFDGRLYRSGDELCSRLEDPVHDTHLLLRFGRQVFRCGVLDRRNELDSLRRIQGQGTDGAARRIDDHGSGRICRSLLFVCEPGDHTD